MATKKQKALLDQVFSGVRRGRRGPGQQLGYTGLKVPPGTPMYESKLPPGTPVGGPRKAWPLPKRGVR